MNDFLQKDSHWNQYVIVDVYVWKELSMAESEKGKMISIIGDVQNKTINNCLLFTHTRLDVLIDLVIDAFEFGGSPQIHSSSSHQNEVAHPAAMITSLHIWL
jgi:hypothetical protein